MTVNEKGLEAAKKVYRYEGLKHASERPIDERALEAAIDAYLRAASKEAEPVAWTSPGNLDGLRDHDSLVIGSMCNRQGDGWTVPLYLTAIEPVAASPDVMREARGALAIALSAIEKAGDDLQASGAYPVGALAALIVPAEQVRTAITNIDRALSSKQRSGE